MKVCSLSFNHCYSLNKVLSYSEASGGIPSCVSRLKDRVAWYTSGNVWRNWPSYLHERWGEK